MRRLANQSGITSAGQQGNREVLIIRAIYAESPGSGCADARRGNMRCFRAFQYPAPPRNPHIVLPVTVNSSA